MIGGCEVCKNLVLFGGKDRAKTETLVTENVISNGIISGTKKL